MNIDPVITMVRDPEEQNRFTIYAGRGPAVLLTARFAPVLFETATENCWMLNRHNEFNIPIGSLWIRRMNQLWCFSDESGDWKPFSCAFMDWEQALRAFVSRWEIPVKAGVFIEPTHDECTELLAWKARHGVGV
jgi:hypothetical protein